MLGGTGYATIGGMLNVSVIIPVYNERKTILNLLARVQETGIPSEVIIVDDGSTDGTAELLQSHDLKGAKVVIQAKNCGKGAAVMTGFQHVTGEVVIIQDADLEYDPREYANLLRPIEEDLADVVYGSRFLGGARRPTMYWHMVANKLLTWMTNILYNNILTDMETGYKVFRRSVLDGVKIKARRFDFEPEFTAKILKKRARIYEVPISFTPRSYEEGKKIKLRDAFAAVWAIVKFRFVN